MHLAIFCPNGGEGENKGAIDIWASPEKGQFKGYSHRVPARKGRFYILAEEERGLIAVQDGGTRHGNVKEGKYYPQNSLSNHAICLNI